MDLLFNVLLAGMVIVLVGAIVAIAITLTQHINSWTSNKGGEIKTFTLDATIIGGCTITITAESLEDASEKLRKGDWKECELTDWEVESFDVDDLEELER